MSARLRSMALCGSLLALGACHHPLPTAQPENPPAPGEARAVSDAGPSTVNNVPAPPPAPVIPPAPVKPRPVKIRITVRSVPPKAKVSWGRKKLGVTPVFLDRPRDSGPVDLVVRSDGFFPVHVRAYTFRNDKLVVRLTKLEDRLTLFGAKHEPAPTAPDVTASGPVPLGPLGAPAPPPSLAAPGASTPPSGPLLPAPQPAPPPPAPAPAP